MTNKPKKISLYQLFCGSVMVHVVLSFIISIFNSLEKPEFDIVTLLIGILIYYVFGFLITAVCGFACVYFLTKARAFTWYNSILLGGIVAGLLLSSLFAMRVYPNWGFGMLGAIAGWLFWLYGQRFSYEESEDAF